MIILIASNKGGTGKTTVAINLSVSLLRKNKRVCMLDADRQRSLTKWNDIREEENIKPKVPVFEKFGNISTTLKELDEKFDFVIVDVAGRNSIELLTGMTATDVIIAPHQCSQQDLDTLLELRDQIKEVKAVNPHVRAFCYQTMASTSIFVNGSDRNDFINFVSAIDNIKLLNSIGYYRRSYRTSYSDGRSVLETSDEKSKQEILELTQEILIKGTKNDPNA